ncbi:MAG: hypothetical protein ACD_76C00015G0006 [uncultured bacterium]|nr:MAG: hypothetical protein ACD_76C00015G0006 [uncultured bacterium]HBD05061.1 hypothetical protein [Candidatus Uhrbacteria bacterium]
MIFFGKPERFRNAVLAFVSAIFFLSTSALAFSHKDQFNSPDENAVFVFTNAFIDSNKFWVEEPKNIEADGLLHPRSALVLGTRIVPASFLGLPFFYGIAGKIAGNWVILYLTSIAAIVAAFAWRRILLSVFSPRAAFIGAILFLSHPALLYYTGRGLFPNVFFASLLVCAFERLITADKNNALFRILFSSLLFSSAMFVRSSEIIWTLVLFAFVLIIKRAIFGWQKIVLFPIFSVLFFAPVMFLHSYVYSNPLATGYSLGQGAQTLSDGESAAFNLKNILTKIWNALLPFGFHPRAVLRHAYDYGIAFFPLLSLFAAVGSVISLFFAKTNKKILAYIFVSIFVTAWLWILYGSWTFFDNPDPRKITIGTSYVRYWLPSFVLLSGFCAFALDRIASLVPSRKAQSLFLCSMLIIFFAYGAKLAFFEREEGLVIVSETLSKDSEIRRRLLESTETDSIIVVDRADKILFPYRSVVQPLRSEATYNGLLALMKIAPLYYFGLTLPQTDMEFLKNTKLYSFGIVMEPVLEIGNQSLYKFQTADGGI